MQYRIDVLAYGEKRWATNALRYDDQESAESAAEDLYVRWTMVDKWRTVTDDTPLRETYVAGSETGPN